MDTGDAAPLSGAGAVVVAIGGILLATAVSPAFAWRANALSDLGVTASAAGTTATVAIFNGGLILGGLLGIHFAAVCYRTAEDGWGRSVAGLLGLTLALLSLVGVFPMGTRPHLPVAAGFYLLLSFTLWADAVVTARRGESRWLLVSGSAGTVNALGWVVWGTTAEPFYEGLAVPEFVGALALGAWVCARSLALARGTRVNIK